MGKYSPAISWNVILAILVCAIQAAAFGWLPVLLWILLGGIFFGAVTDFGALYASVKNEGKSMGMLIEQYIGKTGRKLFLLFCWLFTLILLLHSQIWFLALSMVLSLILPQERSQSLQLTVLPEAFPLCLSPSLLSLV